MDEKKRQSLIVGGVAVAVLCLGGYDVFDRIIRKQTKEKPSSLNSKQLITLATQATAPEAESEIAARVFAMVEATWDEDTFVHGKLIADEHVEKPAEPEATFNYKDFDYSGFLRAGNKMIAIVNGIDYMQGEVVKGFTIDKITEDSLTLSKSGKKIEVKIR